MTAVVKRARKSGGPQESARPAVEDVALDELALRLVAEARLKPHDLTAAQRQRFSDVAAAITTPPTDLQVHRSATSSAKRMIDLAGSLLGLMLTAAVAVPIALAIRLDSPGPIFFKHTRCGLLGEPFVMWKFRSMEHGVQARGARSQDVDTGAGFEGKSAADARITRVGRFLRSTSLDELPQFLNVWRGEMSLVGTRPPTPFEVCAYDQHSWQRLQVKTGLTGEWQVGGRSEIKDFSQVVDLDMCYQQVWNLRHDIALLARTLPAVLRRRGAV